LAERFVRSVRIRIHESAAIAHHAVDRSVRVRGNAAEGLQTMEVPAEFIEILSATLSPDQNQRLQAEERLQHLEKTELGTLLT
jgi:hypothetical protein